MSRILRIALLLLSIVFLPSCLTPALSENPIKSSVGEAFDDKLSGMWVADNFFWHFVKGRDAAAPATVTMISDGSALKGECVIAHVQQRHFMSIRFASTTSADKNDAKDIDGQWRFIEYKFNAEGALMICPLFLDGERFEKLVAAGTLGGSVISKKSYRENKPEESLDKVMLTDSSAKLFTAAADFPVSEEKSFQPLKRIYRPEDK